jgi:O-antigen biosynthesis protein WbqP
MLDRLLAFILLFLFSPIFLIVLLFILFEDGFPAFFKQKRVGIKYTFFNIYKFRSMKKNTPNVATHLLDNPKKYVLKTGLFIKKLVLMSYQIL